MKDFFFSFWSHWVTWENYDVGNYRHKTLSLLYLLTVSPDYFLRTTETAIPFFLPWQWQKNLKCALLFLCWPTGRVVHLWTRPGRPGLRRRRPVEWDRGLLRLLRQRRKGWCQRCKEAFLKLSLDIFRSDPNFCFNVYCPRTQTLSLKGSECIWINARVGWEGWASQFLFFRFRVVARNLYFKLTPKQSCLEKGFLVETSSFLSNYSTYDFKTPLTDFLMVNLAVCKCFIA